MKLNHIYKFNLKEAGCSCIDNVTNIFKIPCVHVIFLLVSLELPFTCLDLSARRNIRNALIKPDGDRWKILGPPSRSENFELKRF